MVTAAILGSLLVAAGCGSTHSDGELARTSGSSLSAANPAPADGVSPSQATIAAPGATNTLGTMAQGNLETRTVGQQPTAASGTGPGTPKEPASAAAPAPKARASSSGALPTDATSRNAPTGEASPGPPAVQTPSPGPNPAPGPVSEPRVPVVIGSIGTESGPIGNILLPVVHGAQAWVADVNARGGLAGHPVRVLFGDDGGDPGKALALAQRMVDQDGVVAFFAMRGPGTGQAVMPFLEQRKIPLVGSCGCDVASARSPMAFNIGAGGEYGLTWYHVLPLLAFSDKRKVSIIYCRESPTCKRGRDLVVSEIAKQVGLQVVHEAQVTVAQPDYTAEALGARNAGAEAMLLFFDNASMIRMARAAHRQSYYPLFSTQFSAHEIRLLKNGGKDVEGFVATGVLPLESPVLADYRAAIQRYVPGGQETMGSWSIMGWAAGKAFELAGKAFPAGKVASADILQGLYQFANGQTLGGIVAPLDFREGQANDKSKSSLCGVPMKVENGKFVPRDGDNRVCPPGV